MVDSNGDAEAGRAVQGFFCGRCRSLGARNFGAELVTVVDEHLIYQRGYFYFYHV